MSNVQAFTYGFTQSINDVMQVAYAAERYAKPRILTAYDFLTCDEARKVYRVVGMTALFFIAMGAHYAFMAGVHARRAADNYVAQCEAVDGSPTWDEIWDEYDQIRGDVEEEVCFPSYENTPAPQADEPESVEEFTVIQSGAIALDIPTLPTVKEIKALARPILGKKVNFWKPDQAHAWYQEYLAQQ